MHSETKSKPTVEAFANGARVWLAKPDGTSDWWACFATPEEVDELITALELARQQAWSEKQNDVAR